MNEIKNDFKKVIAILKHLNLNLKDPKKPINFQTRLIIQKIVFLSKYMKIKLGSYNFSLYKNGPYSPGLTADYYQNNDLITTLVSEVQLTPKEKGIVDSIKNLILNHPLNIYHQADFLEAISTAYYFKYYDEALLDDELFERTKAEKPYISDKIIIIALNTVKKLFFKPEYLTEDIKKELALWDNVNDE
jgi:uncharacterized protein YwgA